MSRGELRSAMYLTAVLENFDYQVIKLQRVRVMNIKLDKLKIGEWRDLTEAELSELFAQLS